MRFVADRWSNRAHVSDVQTALAPRPSVSRGVPRRLRQDLRRATLA
jgi:hypothetical protein